jgi:5'-3' exonuclease
MSKTIALIDADSIIYIVAWNHKDSEEMFVLQAVDSLIQSIFQKTQATHYVMALSSEYNFRDEVYTYDVYKGNRGPKPEWVEKWEATIKGHLKTTYNAFKVMEYEADDILATMGPQLMEDLENKVIYCSPDKDLKQLMGFHFNYRVMDSDVLFVTQAQAHYNFCMQLLMGDTTDNVAGIPGTGPETAKKLLKAYDFTDEADCIDAIIMITERYNRHFGPVYGPKIYKETYKVLTLVKAFPEAHITGTSTVYAVPVNDSFSDLPTL